MSLNLSLKLPRSLEADPRRAAVETALAHEARPLWEKGLLAIPHVAFSGPLEKALIAAKVSRHLERGLEHIETFLANEENGLALAREKQGAVPAGRTSRLLVIADEGSERFYRSCEATLMRHGDRVMGLRVAVSCSQLALSLFGMDKLVKVVLVTDRDATAAVLLSLVS